MADESDTIPRSTQRTHRTGPVTALDGAKQRAGEAFEHFESNPMALVLGGMAVGAIVGALLPRLAREKELLAPLGKRLADGASAAAQAAREKGKAELGALMPSSDETKARVSKLVDGVIDAAKQGANTAKSKRAKS